MLTKEDIVINAVIEAYGDKAVAQHTRTRAMLMTVLKELKTTAKDPKWSDEDLMRIVRCIENIDTVIGTLADLGIIERGSDHK